MHKVEHAMNSGIGSGGNTRPGDLALWRIGDGEMRIITGCGVFSKVGHPPGFIQLLKDARIEGIQAQQDRLHG